MFCKNIVRLAVAEGRHRGIRSLATALFLQIYRFISEKRPKWVSITNGHDRRKLLVYIQNISPLVSFFPPVTTRKNKAGYTATEVACGWAEAIFEVTRPFGQEQRGKKKNHKKVKCDGPTDRRTKRGVESRARD